MRSGKGRLTVFGVTILFVAAMSVIPAAFAASMYSWTISCKRTGGLVGNVYAQWNWTSNGVSLQSNTAFCGSGSGTVPSNANGITARLVTEFSRGPGCFNQDSVTKSFAPGTVPSISLKSHCETSAYGQRDTVSATLTLS